MGQPIMPIGPMRSHANDKLGQPMASQISSRAIGSASRPDPCRPIPILNAMIVYMHLSSLIVFSCCLVTCAVTCTKRCAWYLRKPKGVQCTFLHQASLACQKRRFFSYPWSQAANCFLHELSQAPKAIQQSKQHDLASWEPS